MQIPVLMGLPHQEPLVESALAFREFRDPRFALSEANIPRALALDATFPAIPMGRGRGSTMAAHHDPQASETFAVRGFIEAESPEAIPVEVEGRPVFADPKIAPFLTCGGTSSVGDVAAVAAKLGIAQLHARGLDGDGVAIAIMDTGINLAHLAARLPGAVQLDATNSWRPQGMTILPGRHPVDHGTMCAFDALIAAPKATLLDFPILASNVPGGSAMGGTLSVAVLAYAQLLAGWAVAFAPGGLPKYKALVVNNSWGIYHPSWDFPVGHPGRYCDNPRHPFHLLVSALSGAGVDILFAAGNCGAECADGRCLARTQGAIMGASAHRDVLTLAGCDTSDRRVGYSSQGPSIAGMHPEKPDVTAYTHFLGSEAFGANDPDTGTSAACPVAAGCVAAIRTKAGPAATPPANLNDQLRASARAAGAGGGWNGDYGHGIIDPLAAATSMGL